MTRQDLISRLNAMKPWLEKRGVVRLRLVGSRARGDGADSSDVDLLAAFSSPISLWALAELEQDIAERLGARVDLATEAGLKPRVRDRLERDAVDV